MPTGIERSNLQVSGIQNLILYLGKAYQVSENGNTL